MTNINEMKYNQLKAECKAQGLAAGGTKEDLITRLQEGALAAMQDATVIAGFVGEPVLHTIEKGTPEEAAAAALLGIDLETVDPEPVVVGIDLAKDFYDKTIDPEDDPERGAKLAAMCNQIFSGVGTARYNANTNCLEFRGTGSVEDHNINCSDSLIRQRAIGYKTTNRMARNEGQTGQGGEININNLSADQIQQLRTKLGL